VAIIYGKSNCGKSELINTLMHSMFGYAGFLPNEMFTVARVWGVAKIKGI
jgi:GTP-binding protein EngB required for normal cell division